MFSETAVVFDEGRTHHGKAEVKKWIEEANTAYKAAMKALDYSETAQALKAEISGTFLGSPIVLQYQFEINGKGIQSLKII